MVAVLFLDLDGFKAVNDTLGHQAGDSVLKTVATRLNDSLRETDAVCRLGGDEFVMMLPTIHDIGEVVHVAEKLISSIAEPIPIGNGTTAEVTASIGISTLSTVHTSSSSLITAADEAMFASKRLGKNRFAVAP